MKTRYQPAILSFHLIVLWAEKLTPTDLAEIENLLYKSRSLNMKQVELHQYLSKEKCLFSNPAGILAIAEILTWTTK